jgi:hypothetical protein
MKVWDIRGATYMNSTLSLRVFSMFIHSEVAVTNVLVAQLLQSFALQHWVTT